MSTPDHDLAVLFADIAGSTQPLRAHRRRRGAGGDQPLPRRSPTASAQGCGGRLVKTIGDEALLLFPTADAAAAAAGGDPAPDDRGRRWQRPAASGFGSDSTTAPRSRSAGDVFGDAVNVAARMVGLAKRGQVILSQPTARRAVAGARRAGARARRADGEGQGEGHRHLRAALAGFVGGPDRDGGAAGRARGRAWSCGTARARSSWAPARRRSRSGAMRRTTW